MVSHDQMRRYRYTKKKTFAALVALVSLSIALLPGRVSHAAPMPAVTRAQATINVGYKNFAEEQIIGDMYIQLLDKHGFHAVGHQLTETPFLQSALMHGQIDLYPEYTGTGLGVLGITKAITNPIIAYDMVKTRYQRRFHLTWLNQAPMNDTNGIGVTQATAAKYHLHNLSQLARVASKLTFAEDPACKTRPDCLAGMQANYGIHFKSVTDIPSGPLRYSGLKSGQFDVIEVFTTDAPIKADHVVVLKDNKGKVFPADHIAPIVRDTILTKYPKIRAILNPLAPFLTTKALIRLNGEVILHNKDAATVARNFLRSKHLL